MLTGQARSNQDVPAVYHLSARFRLRLLGGSLLALGVLVVLAAVLVALTPVPAWVLTAVVLLALVGLGALLVRLRAGAPVVRLEDDGYQVRMVRGAGTKAARWTDVEDVAATTVRGARCVVLRLRDGRATVIPVDILRVSPDDFVRDLQQHLNRGHGYRTLRAPR